MGIVEVFEPGLEELIRVSAELEVLTSGFRFTEGPAWHASDSALLFSDIPANTIYRWSGPDGVSVVRSPSGSANGLALGRCGSLDRMRARGAPGNQDEEWHDRCSC